jgi:hypothetical protein
VEAQSYYQALCLEKLGQNDRAQTLFHNLVDSGQKMLQQSGARGGGPGRAATASAHYLAGLGYLGLHDTEKAKAELNLALEASPDLVGARSALAAIQ